MDKDNLKSIEDKLIELDKLIEKEYIEMNEKNEKNINKINKFKMLIENIIIEYHNTCKKIFE